MRNVLKEAADKRREQKEREKASAERNARATSPLPDPEGWSPSERKPATRTEIIDAQGKVVGYIEGSPFGFASHPTRPDEPVAYSEADHAAGQRALAEAYAKGQAG